MRILVSAYACEPGKGSEPGVGWNWARELSKEHEVWVLTRSNNRAPIEAELSAHPTEHPQMHFLYVDLEGWARRLKRGQRGIHAYYYAWQVAARRVALRAHAEAPFDLVHHLTFASAFSPALVRIPGIPFVWGPVGGGVRVPWRLVSQGGAEAVAYEALRASRRLVGRYLDPLVRGTWRKADLILVQNEETLAWIPRRHRPRARIESNCGIDEREIARSERAARGDGGFLAVAAGRLIHLKGFALAIRALADVHDERVRLMVVGEGPQRRSLEELAARVGVADRVTFLGQLRRHELLSLFRRADVLLFPSLHDEGGFVVVESMSQGAIPIVLGIGGPPTLAGPVGSVVPVRGRSAEEVVSDLASAVRVASTQDLEALRSEAIERARRLAWSAKPRALDEILPTTEVPITGASA